MIFDDDKVKVAYLVEMEISPENNRDVPAYMKLLSEDLQHLFSLRDRLSYDFGDKVESIAHVEVLSAKRIKYVEED